MWDAAAILHLAFPLFSRYTDILSKPRYIANNISLRKNHISLDTRIQAFSRTLLKDIEGRFAFWPKCHPCVTYIFDSRESRNKACAQSSVWTFQPLLRGFAFSEHVDGTRTWGNRRRRFGTLKHSRKHFRQATNNINSL